MVEIIEEYGNVLKVILKPTKKFPYGYFYTDNNEVALNLVKNYNWHLKQSGKNIYVQAKAYSNLAIQFHQEYANKLLSYYPSCIDHINRVEIDNRNTNLNVVTQQQNMRNQPSVGYQLTYKNCFIPYYKSDNNLYYRGTYHTEPEALLATYNLRQQVYSDYNYDFYLDRRDDEDILDAELTRKITTQQAIYLHVKRYVSINP